MSKIILIHSDDEDLHFLKPLVKSLEDFWGEKLDSYLLDITLKSHSIAQEQIKNSPDNTLIIILCHGGSNYILGNRNMEELGVNDDHFEFLNSRNISIIERKKMICLSCNSREGLGNLVINNGGLGLIGFGDIRFDDPRLLKKGVNTDNQVQELSKKEMILIFWETIILSLNNDASLKDFVNYFKLIVNKHCDKLILENKGNVVFVRTANFLWHLKNEILLFGNKEIKLF